MRYRTRTLLLATTTIVVLVGGARWYYNARVGEHERQRKIVERLSSTGVSILWSYVGPRKLDAWKMFDGPAFRRPTHAYCDGVEDEAFASVVAELGELDITTVLVLGRQILPHAEAGGDERVLEGLRRHRTLRQIAVDASIRGTPAAYDAPIYTRENLARLEEALPNLEIVWIEVN